MKEAAGLGGGSWLEREELRGWRAVRGGVAGGELPGMQVREGLGLLFGFAVRNH